MADSKITALTALTAADPINDVIPIVDVSDTSMAASGTTKKISVNNILGASGTATLASATISGDLTVHTSTLKVDSANNRVIVGHTSGSSAFQVTNAGAAGLEIQPTGFSSAPLILSYNRSGSAYTQLTLDGSTIVHAISGTTAMTLNSSGNVGIGVTPTNLTGQTRVEIKGSAIGNLTLRTSSGSAAARDWQIACNLDNFGELNFRQGASQGAEPNSGTTRMVLDASGNLLVGTPSGTLSRIISSFLSSSGNGGIRLIDSESNNTAIFANFSNGTGTLGSITNNNNAGVLYNVTSDKRLKENISDSESASLLIDSLQVRKFDWKANNSHQRYGFIAQELVTVVPEAVYQPTNSDDMMAVDYSKLVPVLVKEIQSLRTRVQTLETR